MHIIKKITKDGHTLTHSWYIDDFGLKKNSFDLFSEETRTHFPFHGSIRVNDYDRNTPYSEDDISAYKEGEYLEMFEEQVKWISS